MVTRNIVLAFSALVFSTGLVLADEMEPVKQCDALGDAFTNYSANKTDPDKEKATALYQDGVGDCRDGRYDDGINKMNNAMGMMHDGTDSGHSGRR